MATATAVDQFNRIDGVKTFPGFALCAHRLHYVNPEWGYADDGPFTLELVTPQVALISGDDGRGTSDGSPCYRKFLAFSKTPDKRIITAYLAYIYTGPVGVRTWKPELRGLLKDIDMEHYNITPDRVPDRLLAKHRERTNGQVLVQEGLRELAEKTFFDMLWNVDSR